MTKISGVLIDGAGQPLTNVQIVLTALKTSSKVIVQSKALITTTSETGAYSINAQIGRYAVTLLRNGYPVEKVGCISIYSDSDNGTLNDFLMSPSESEITPEILAQVVDERKQAQQAAQSAQASANQTSSTLTNSVKKTGETTQTVSGTLSAATLQEKGKRVYSPNNKPTASDVGALALNGVNAMTGDFKVKKDTGSIEIENKDGDARFRIRRLSDGVFSFLISGSAGDLNRLLFYPTTNTWNFTNSYVTINSTPVQKVGDYGVGAAGVAVSNFDDPAQTSCFFTTTTGVTDNPATTASNGIQVMRGSTSRSAISWNPNNKQVFSGRFNVTTWEWCELITTSNSTVDSNGFYKKASPIYRLFANDNNISEVDGFKIAGCGLVNSEADGVIAKRIDVGHYEIHGSLGFAKEGWYITLPEDANGNKKCFAEFTTDENNIITVKTFTRKFDIEQCAIVAGEPQDITEDRWIDIRLEMPMVEINDEVAPIPSTLNPVIY